MSDLVAGTPAAELPFVTKEALLGLSGSRFHKTIPTPLGKLQLRSLVGAESFEIDNFAFDAKGGYERNREKYARAKRVIETVVDQNGNKMFTDFDLEAIANWPEPLLNTIAVEVVAMAKPEALGAFAKNA